MTNIWEKFKWLWTNLLWFIAGLVLLVDPRHVYEWAHQHEAWAGLITAVWAALLAWAAKHRPQQPDQVQQQITPPGTFYPPGTKVGGK